MRGMSLRILAVNSGSSSLKGSVVTWPALATAARVEVALPADQPVSLDAMLARAGRVDAVAHRVVHGGARFREAVRIDGPVRAALAELCEIDPLHAPRAIAGIDAAQRALPRLPHFACFDTVFHAALPEAAATYALPRAWIERWGLRRYGFHGLSVAHAARRAPELARAPLRRVIVAHLGSGCSVTAVADGRSVDTTMGYTPLEGVVMATRSGSVDPGLLIDLLRTRGLSIDALERGLVREGGLLGLSGASGDLRAVRAAAEAGDARARLAIDVFVRSVQRAVGQVATALDGLDALVFTGGIGEHDAGVRAAVLANLGWMGLGLDPRKNEAASSDADLSAERSPARVLVIEAREDLTMVREAAALLGEGQ